jgi:DNA-binding NtrC family response regulator
MKRRKHRILVVDDERDICRALDFLLSGDGHEVESAGSGEEALELFRKREHDLVLTDLKMEGMDGIELIEKLRTMSSSAVLILMTAYASVENAVDAMKKGANDYVVKPFSNDDVRLTVRRLLEHQDLRMENQALRRELSNRMASGEFIGNSPKIGEIFETLEKVAPTKSNILLLGESGTGKSMVAELIHRNSPRRGGYFLSINCSAIPETLLESELFGYRKGAFTGAHADKTGLIASADGGTLFLDEIGDMPLGLQAKLLNVIETGEVLPVGGTRPVSVDVRFISATNRDLEEVVRNGEFREDLFYRLDVIRVTIPPLRERREDIPLLAAHFIRKSAHKHDKGVKGMDDDAMEALCGYRWPGNARELANVLERAVLLCGSDSITLADLPEKLRLDEGTEGVSLKASLDLHERVVILGSLNEHGWDKEQTAHDLGINLATLYRKLKKLGIEEGREH